MIRQTGAAVRRISECHTWKLASDIDNFLENHSTIFHRFAFAVWPSGHGLGHCGGVRNGESPEDPKELRIYTRSPRTEISLHILHELTALCGDGIRLGIAGPGTKHTVTVGRMPSANNILDTKINE